jgi:2-polyprenyl-6-methoxyphenol hydroxylase-like FAD-dependent oxidoreductase
VDIQKGSALLIGDASGFIDPLTGEGMASAIRTAFILIDEIKKRATIQEAFEHYGLRRKEEFRNKEILNLGFQKIIKSPSLCEVVAQTLGLSRRLRNTFIGVIGNVYDPVEATRVLASLYLNER